MSNKRKVLVLSEKKINQTQTPILIPGVNRLTPPIIIPGGKMYTPLPRENLSGKITAQEVRDFQSQVINNFLTADPNNTKITKLLDQTAWMGMNDQGKTVADLNDQELEKLIKLVGPGIFKIMRISPDLIFVLEQAQQAQLPIISSGGSCLFTSADTNVWRTPIDQVMKICLPGEKPELPTRQITGALTAKELIKKIQQLPTLMQIFDASLPLAAADEYVNIIEDSLFALTAPKCTAPAGREKDFQRPFLKEGQRHSRQFTKLLKIFDSPSRVLSTFFSKLPIAEFNRKFWHSDQMLGHLRSNGLWPEKALELDRSQVMFSFTGFWADMLRQIGHIPTEAVYLVVEPFHHFTETHNGNGNGAYKSPVYRLNESFDSFCRDNPYGVTDSANSGAQGAIAFLPAVAPNAALGFSNITMTESATAASWQDYLTDRQKLLDKPLVPGLLTDKLLLDGLNFLYYDYDCRQALHNLTELGLKLLNEARQSGKKSKKVLKAARRDPANVKLAHENHEILFNELEWLLATLFG